MALRRFQSRRDASSFGWVYCGSHNFSAAAWGRPIYSSLGRKVNELGKAKSCLGSRLHVCNYELGIVFIFPPKDCKNSMKLDDIVLPFVVPAPKYGPTDRPATALAMRLPLTELRDQGRENLIEVEEIPDEEESVEATDFVVEEKEEEKAYAEVLWNHIDSSESC